MQLPESRFGAQIQADGRTRFRLWAPSVAEVQIEFHESGQRIDMQAMQAIGEGWFEAVLENRPAGALYSFVLPGGKRVPEPASRFQPHDVHGPSEVIDPSRYRSRHPEWTGRPWHEAVLYELHIGSFTQEGTFAAAARRLDHLAELGVTGVQPLPVADFCGARNWGYDGALLRGFDVWKTGRIQSVRGCGA